MGVSEFVPDEAHADELRDDSIDCYDKVYVSPNYNQGVRDRKRIMQHYGANRGASW